MKIEDFKYEDPDKYLTKKYIFESEDYVLVIDEDIFDEETVQYANDVISKYLKEKEIIIQYMIDKRLRQFYSKYSDEYIKENLGKPQITIYSRKDEQHPNWKFKYAGIIDYIESDLDEHIISIEFIDDLDLYDHVQIDG